MLLFIFGYHKIALKRQSALKISCGNAKMLITDAEGSDKTLHTE